MMMNMIAFTAIIIFAAILITSIGASNVFKFRANAGFAYLPNLLSSKQHEVVRQRVFDLKKSSLKAEKGSYAKGRLGCRLSRDDKLSEIFSCPSVLTRVKKVSGRSEKLHIPLSDFPLEVRAYPIGSEMDWHKDDILYKEKQLELVYTVENDSDSEFCWVDARGAINRIFTEPNSLVVLEADSVRHRVTRLGKGTRTIIKTLAVEDGVVLNEDYFSAALETYGFANSRRANAMNRTKRRARD